MRPIDADALTVVIENTKKVMEDRGNIIDAKIAQNMIEVVSSEVCAPTLDYAPVRHASWIRQDDTYTRFQCGGCKSKNFDRQWVFCPLCGARMDGGKSDV